MMDQNKVGNLVKELRKKSGLTQEKFALKYGVTYQAVSKWENGKNIPDIALLTRHKRHKPDLSSIFFPIYWPTKFYTKY